MKFRGIAAEVFSEIERIQKSREQGLLDFEECLDKKQNIVKNKMPRKQVSEKDNQGDPVLIGIDADGNLRVYSMKDSRPPRLTPPVVKILWDFIRENYEVD
jgi:hypothetical protein